MQNSGSEMHEMCVLPELLTYLFFPPTTKVRRKRGTTRSPTFFKLIFLLRATRLASDVTKIHRTVLTPQHNS